MMKAQLQRKYVELIREVSSKWANWDPPIGMKVGTYGTVDKETGDLNIEGNIYDASFQKELDKVNTDLRLADYPPTDGTIEDDFIIASKGVKRKDWNIGADVNVQEIANISIKGQWEFENGKRGALLVLSRPRMTYLPPDVVLKHLYKVPLLKNMWLVTNVYTCPAYSMYLSNKTGERVCLALVAKVPSGAIAPGISTSVNAGLNWITNTQSDFIRRASHEAGEYTFTPLYTLKRPIGTLKLFRDKITLPKVGDDLWDYATPPWDPLDEDGEEDSIDTSISWDGDD